MGLGWSYMEGVYQAPPLRSMPASFAVGALAPARWYELRVTAANDAGAASTVYTYATKTSDGGEIGPPSDYFDLNMLVIICSSVLLVGCMFAFVCILLRRHRIYKGRTNLRTFGKCVITAAHGHPHPQRNHLCAASLLSKPEVDIEVLSPDLTIELKMRSELCLIK
ncbi:hypothetical protein EVAR_82199_1 [Eumeta japonica]|uniref:DSCAM/DSCAML C-terminal domain-containing protein n=1 Tax=Eumeta variegata TaxID=151549 RepID=A0A4C1W561_EUMVA|nr:hypothetical protein EVAR_82199_1 [Eumeta japonica]